MVVILIVDTQHKSRIGPFGGSGGLFGRQVVLSVVHAP